MYIGSRRYKSLVVVVHQLRHCRVLLQRLVTLVQSGHTRIYLTPLLLHLLRLAQALEDRLVVQLVVEYHLKGFLTLPH